jgi:translocation and assembly module TamB
VHRVFTSPDLALGLRLDPLDLSGLRADLPQIARASGTVRGEVRVEGAPRSPRLAGSVHLAKGELALKGSPFALDDLSVDVAIGSGEVRLTHASARVGGGTVTMNARMPVRGLELGTATAVVTARGVKLPVADGVDLTADADLDATYRPGAASIDGERNLPDVKGTVSLTSFRYTRPITMSLNLSQLTGKPQRTHVETYDPADDFVRFRLTVVSPRPLRFTNNLVDMQLEVADPGLVLSGTNQRFGAQGILRVLPDSKLKLRSTEFDVREGFVRFDDPARIAPNVEVRAQTEYRRYAESAGAEAAATQSGSGAAGANTSGQWRISLHAHGEPESLKLALTSDPPLGQEDIVLLLTMGMTRAEIDRGLASSLGQTVGLEALSQLTGADQAVKTIVPLIDEFRFGTGYSSRTGRTEPTVTLGKRVTDSVRANVTTGLTENREVRSSVEWKISHRTSVQGSYDNVNDVSSSALGNVGADLRWRLEFE